MSLQDGVKTLGELAAAVRGTQKTLELVALEGEAAQQEYIEKSSGLPLRFPSASGNPRDQLAIAHRPHRQGQCRKPSSLFPSQSRR